jgi:IMP dehydrogenase
MCYNFAKYLEGVMNERKELFFQRMEEQELALTFDDVRLRTRHSKVAAPEVDLSSRFSQNVDLKVPIVSAAMDTVTESAMAIAMAKLGGIGVIHSAMSVKQQGKEVRRVKYHLSGLIEEPIYFSQDRTLESIENECRDKNFNFRSFPILNGDGQLAGLLTGHHFKYTRDKSISHAEERMTPVSEMVIAEPKTDMHAAYELMVEREVGALVLAGADLKVAGMYIWSDVERLVEGNPNQYNLDSRGRLRVAAAVPTDPEEAIARIDAMFSYLDVAVINSAQGDSRFAVDTLIACKEKYHSTGPDIAIGNISEGESAEMLANHGTDGILAGQGPGSICTTRRETGIGMPQVSAVYDCIKGVDRSRRDVPVCADGGLKDPGDIPIALAAGASSVMMGSMLAGTKETPGEITLDETGRPVKQYRGMASPSALKDSAASRKRYDAEGVPGKPLAEGVESTKPYVGSVVDVMDLYTKALRRAMSYVGAPNVKALREEVLLRRITSSGLRESHPHDVKVVSK